MRFHKTSTSLALVVLVLFCLFSVISFAEARCSLVRLRGTWTLGWEGRTGRDNRLIYGLGAMQVRSGGRVQNGWIAQTVNAQQNATFSQILEGNFSAIRSAHFCFIKLTLEVNASSSATPPSANFTRPPSVLTFEGVLSNDTSYMELIYTSEPGAHVFGSVSKVKGRCNSTASLRGVWGTTTQYYEGVAQEPREALPYSETFVCKKQKTCDSFYVFSRDPGRVYNLTGIPHTYVRGSPCGYFRLGGAFDGHVVVSFGEGLYKMMTWPSRHAIFAKYFGAKR